VNVEHGSAAFDAPCRNDFIAAAVAMWAWPGERRPARLLSDKVDVLYEPDRKVMVIVLALAIGGWPHASS